ncbi:biotin--[acetyl-CoA-carboxylase] ligase [Ktedonosporobacter rubrisoli]|uniref:biotin--[biotin carboxyl-carrier protein] ligase n=1 Tax=Ktedonosporobacter rubrisoli TaxID=2509675 RepID=A0A4P6K238_KTERU|nr:biotin--[acetyl-CoA-carboxylase] ligase [Ktedonosporobacter rubrisoli]QBD81952.1 biotin--[acetyl-CoA-carboxylase] ligase [Ktedonosporobacter rubrisoli]
MKKIESTAFKQLDVEAIQRQLDTRFFGIGNHLVFLSTVDSTNVLAMQLAQDGSEEGVVVLTDSQTAGKGRLGRHWVDQPGHSVISSTILRPFFPPYHLIMFASLAVVDAIADTCGVAATIKWPNDVLVGDRKVAGILIETSRDRSGRGFAIVGIGVNVNGDFTEAIPSQAVPGLTQAATTLQSACGHRVSREFFITRLLQHMESSYLLLQQEAQDPLAQAYGSSSRLIRERWRNQLSTLGRTIQVRQGDSMLSGIAEDVDEHGELLLRCHSGDRVSITWGDIGYPTQ